MTNHSFEHDCKRIHDSMGDLSQMISSLSCRTLLEKQKLKETFKAMYGEELVSYLQRYEDEFCASMNCSALSWWMLDPHDRDAVVVRESLQQDETDFKALVEIFVCRKSSHVLLITQAYHRMFRRQLDQDIINLDPPHPFQKVRDIIIIIRFIYGNRVTLSFILIKNKVKHKEKESYISSKFFVNLKKLVWFCRFWWHWLHHTKLTKWM